MRIDKICVENFGTLHAYSLDLSDGVNGVFEENGFGKTTLAVFIKAIFYGLGSSRGSISDNERKKYTPWQGGAFGGSIDFFVGDKKYRIERFFGAKESEDTFELYDLATNTLSDDYSENIGEELFGVSVGGYERSTYFSSRVLKGKDDGSILDKLHSMLEDSDADESFESAIGVLSEQKKKLRADRGEGGLIYELERRITDNARAEDELSGLEMSLQVSLEKEAKLVGELCALDGEITQCESALRASLSKKERTMAKNRLAELESEAASARESVKTCEKFFAKQNTDADEVKKYFELERDFQLAKHDAKAACLSDTEKREILAFSAMFDAKNIDTDKINVYRAELTSYERSCAQLDAERDRASESPRYADMFEGGVPSKEKIAEIRALADSVSERKSAKKSTSSSSAKSILVAVCVALGTVGVLIGVLAIAGVIPMPLLAAAGACIAVGALCLGVALVKNKNVGIDEDKLALDEQKIADFLSKYDLSGSIPDSLARLELCAEEYTRELEKKSEEQKRILARLLELDAQKEKILAFISELGGEQDDDMGVGLDTVAARYARYSALREKSEAVDLQKEQATRIMQELGAQLDAYICAYFGERFELSYTEALKAVEDTLAMRRDAADKLSDLLAQIEKYKSQNEALLAVDEGEEEILDPNAIEQKRDELYAKRNEKNSELLSERDKIERISDAPEKLIEAKAQGERLKEELAEAKAKCEALEKTLVLMQDAKENLSTRYIGKMQTAFCTFALECGFGEGIEFLVDSGLGIKVREHSKSREVDYYSRGMREMIELCSRLSLIEVMFEGELPFLVLDDPFANLDDENFARIAALMRSVAEKYQIIYTYCHSSRKI